MAELNLVTKLWRTLLVLAFFCWLLLLGSAQIALVLFIFLFIIIPVIFRFSYTLQRSLLFLNFVRWPRNFNFNAPENAGLSGVQNFYLNTDEGITLGVWHILPSSLVNQSMNIKADEEWYRTQLQNGNPVILYMHGNSGSRAEVHRVGLYKVLRNLNYHVIAFDYRSYGDSSPVEPSEAGVVADAVFVFKWVKKQINGSPLFVWGHSLGTGVSSHALARLAEEGSESYGLVLESPFNNMRDEIRGHPLAQLFKFLPWFEQCFVWSMFNNGLRFNSDENLSKIRAPVAILHAEDDRIVPFYLGERLYQTIQKTRSEDALGVEFWRFKAKFGYGHKCIFQNPSLPDIVKNFVEDSIHKHRKITGRSKV